MYIRLHSINFCVLTLYLSTLFVTLSTLFHIFIHGSFSLVHSILLCEYPTTYLSILPLVDRRPLVSSFQCYK